MLPAVTTSTVAAAITLAPAAAATCTSAHVRNNWSMTPGKVSASTGHPRAARVTCRVEHKCSRNVHNLSAADC